MTETPATALDALRADYTARELLAAAILEHDAGGVTLATWGDIRAALADREAPAAMVEGERFAFLQRQSYDLRCFPVPTGGGDEDIGWRVVGHWQADPTERTIAEVYRDDPIAAVDAAMRLTPEELRAISHPSEAPK